MRKRGGMTVANRGRVYSGLDDLAARHRRGYAVLVPAGLFEGETAFWHIYEHRARQRALRIREKVADVRVIPLFGTANDGRKDTNHGKHVRDAFRYDDEAKPKPAQKHGSPDADGSLFVAWRGTTPLVAVRAASLKEATDWFKSEGYKRIKVVADGGTVAAFQLSVMADLTVPASPVKEAM